MRIRKYTIGNEVHNLIDLLRNSEEVRTFKVVTTRKNSTAEWRGDLKNWNTIASGKSEKEASRIMNYAMKTDSGQWGRSSDHIFKIIKEEK